MRRPSAAAVWGALAVGWLTLVWGLLTTPSPPSLPGAWVPDLVQPWIDKVAHAGLFFVQGALLERATRHRLGGWRAWRAALVVVLLLGAATEIRQRWVPNREASVGDFAADAAGGLLYGLLLLAERSRSGTVFLSESGS